MFFFGTPCISAVSTTDDILVTYVKSTKLHASVNCICEGADKRRTLGTEWQKVNSSVWIACSLSVLLKSLEDMAHLQKCLMYEILISRHVHNLCSNHHIIFMLIAVHADCIHSFFHVTNAWFTLVIQLRSIALPSGQQSILYTIHTRRSLERGLSGTPGIPGTCPHSENTYYRDLWNALKFTARTGT